MTAKAAARNIKRDCLRRRGTNITAGRYVVVCRECGYRTGFTGIIKEADRRRTDHTRAGSCLGSSMNLRGHDGGRRANDGPVGRNS